MIGSIAEIAKIIGAEIRGGDNGGEIHDEIVDNGVAGASTRIDTLLTDSRSFRTGAGVLFFALATASGDGHNYIAGLYSRGVRCFVVSHKPEGCFGGAVFLVVDSPLKALQQLGAARRRLTSGKVIGITGSRGKTIVKEWLHVALRPEQGVVRSPRSYNSQIGVPLSLAAINTDTRLAIIEAGVSKCGEMEALSDMIAPGTAVFTSLCDDHAEGFASQGEKAAEKARLAAHADTVVYPIDNAGLATALAPYAESRRMLGWSFKSKDAPLYVERVEALPDNGRRICYIFNGAHESADIFTGGEHDVENALAVIATMLSLGYEPGRIAYGVRRLPPIATRIDVSDGVNGCLVAHDAFTADADSLASALDFMHRRIAGTDDHRAPTLILSDLDTDIVTDSDALYAQVASLVATAGVGRFIGVGPQLAAHAALFGGKAAFFADTASLMERMSTSDFNNEFVLLKGAPEYGFDLILHELEARTHETVLEVNLDALVRNFNYFRSHLPATTVLIAMVKASAYGAGSLEVAKTLQSHGAAYLAVAVLDEGLDLRRAGITMPIMVMNPKVVNYRAMFAGHLEPEIYGFDMLADVIREAGKCGIQGYPIHIKLDTGMHRMGFNEADLPRLAATLNSTGTVRAATLFSHLATADCPDMDSYTELQLDRFERYTTVIARALPYPVKRHVLNSAGILRYGKTHHYDYARLGIGLYGVNTLPPEMEDPLSVVSTLRTVVIAVQVRAAGESIGYARRGMLHRDSRIATIPIGYADGMNRKFGNGHIKVLVNGHECPTIGNICMDACMIDVTGVPCAVGDPVEIFGQNMPVARLADVLGTITYEVLTSVSPRVKRIYYRE